MLNLYIILYVQDKISIFNKYSFGYPFGNVPIYIKFDTASYYFVAFSPGIEGRTGGGGWQHRLYDYIDTSVCLLPIKIVLQKY